MSPGHKAKGNFCNVEGCFTRSEDDKVKDKQVHFYRLPAIISHQGKETEQLSAERRRLWLAKLNQDISGKNLSNIRICSDHVTSSEYDLIHSLLDL